MARTGRRPGRSGAREAILEEARRSFATKGYDATTIRAVAGAAGVDAALVHHYFGSKDALFAAALELPVTPSDLLPALLAGGAEGLGERIARFFLTVWDGTSDLNPLLALIRSAAGSEQAAAMMREFVSREILGRIAGALDAPDAQLRAALVGSQLIGIAWARYVIRIEPLASTPAEDLACALAPTLQRYLTGDLEFTER